MQNVHVFLRSNMPNFKKNIGHTRSISSFVARETKKHNIISSHLRFLLRSLLVSRSVKNCLQCFNRFCKISQAFQTMNLYEREYLELLFTVLRMSK